MAKEKMDNEELFAVGEGEEGPEAARVSTEEFQLLKSQVEELNRALEAKERELSEAVAERDGLNDELTTYRLSGMTREEQLEAEKAELESTLKEKEDALAAKEKEVESLKANVEKERLNLVKEKILREYPDVLPEWLTATDEASLRQQAQKASEHLAKITGYKKELIEKEEQEKKQAEEEKKAQANLNIGQQMAETSSPGSAQDRIPAEQKDLEERYAKARDDGDVTLATKLRLELSKYRGRQVLETT